MACSTIMKAVLVKVPSIVLSFLCCSWGLVSILFHSCSWPGSHCWWLLAGSGGGMLGNTQLCESSPRPALPAGAETSQCMDGIYQLCIQPARAGCLGCVCSGIVTGRDTPKDESLQDTLQIRGCVLTNFYFHLLINFSGISVYHLLSDVCVVPLEHKAFPRSDPCWMDSMVITT